jgi:hypothetical protein
MTPMARFTSAFVLACCLAACSGTVADGGSDESIVVEPGVEEPIGKADQSAPMMVEVKEMIAAGDVERAADALHLSPSKAERREVYFYDTADLELFDAGLILRTRKVIDGADDSTVKMRPLQANEVSKGWFDLEGFKCEIDQTAGKAIPSCSLTIRQDQGEIDEVAQGTRSVDKLYSSEQELFASSYCPVEPDWGGLQVLGPVDALVWKVKSSKLSGPMTAERWELPNGTVILEVSMKAPQSEAAAVQAELERYLGGKGLSIDNDQETKTRAVLQYYASQN